MDKRRYGKTLSACLAGVSNQAVITNVTALLFVPFAGLYGFSLARLGLLTAVNFAAQMCADVFLMFFIDRLSYRALALAASAASAAGLLFYGLVPMLFSGEALYGGIVAATAVFAFAGGMLEVVLSNVADSLPEESSLSICLLHTVYAWAQAVLALALCGCLFFFGAKNWNFAMFALALVPVAAFVLLIGAETGDKERKADFKGRKRRMDKADGKNGCARFPATSGGKSRFGVFYLFALAAIFFGYGSEVAMNQWVSTLFSETFAGAGYNAEFFGAAAFAAFLGIGGLFYVRISGKRAKFPFSALIFAALATCVCYVAASGEGAFSFAAALACGLVVGFLSPGIMTASAQNLPRAGGRMLASLAVFADLGAAVLPSAAGALSEIFGLKSSFLLLSAAPLCCTLAAVAMRLRKKTPRAPLYSEK